MLSAREYGSVLAFIVLFLWILLLCCVGLSLGGGVDGVVHASDLCSGVWATVIRRGLHTRTSCDLRVDHQGLFAGCS